MPAEISLVEVQPLPIAVVRITTALSTWPKQFRHTLDKVYEAVKAGHVRQGGHNIMIYRRRDDGHVEIECGIEIDARFEPVGEVVCSQIPPGTAVTTAHIGPYQQLGASHDAVVEWSRKNGLQLTGTCWELYRDWNEDTAKLCTDIFHLVRP